MQVLHRNLQPYAGSIRFVRGHLPRFLAAVLLGSAAILVTLVCALTIPFGGVGVHQGWFVVAPLVFCGLCLHRLVKLAGRELPGRYRPDAGTLPFRLGSQVVPFPALDTSA